MILCFVLLGFLSLNGTQVAQSPSGVANASVDDLFEGYDHWSSQHPGVFPRGKTTELHVPSIDLYDPAGTSIYHGIDSETNAVFLNGLTKDIKVTKTSEFRPSLKEAIEMFSGLRAQEGTLLSDKRYTIFVLTYPNWDHCKSQNEAVARLRERAVKIGIRIIEVRLHT